MQQRIVLKQAEPAAYKAMLAFDGYAESTAISTVHKDLIRIRASQINGCSYCVNEHSIEAREHGETEQRIYALPVWRETPFFTEEERAVLALTEEVTFIHNRVSDETYSNAAKLFDEKYLSQLIMAIIVINAWNRIGVATNMMPAVK